MSVLIKGMEMPKNCMSCPFPSVGVDWFYCYCPGVDGKAYDFAQAETVPDDCPLVALPDHHGRLVDADELIHELNNSHYLGAPYVNAGINIAIGKVCDASTIVEQEDES